MIRSPACGACGDPIDDIDERVDRLRRAGLRVHPDELFYCLECASEKFRGLIDSRPAKLYSAGGGSPIIDESDDGGPWEQNNVRIMEDG